MDVEFVKVISAAIGFFLTLNMISLVCIYLILHMFRDILNIIREFRIAKKQGTVPPALDDD